jgi:hypothetical protein
MGGISNMLLPELEGELPGEDISLHTWSTRISTSTTSRTAYIGSNDALRTLTWTGNDTQTVRNASQGDVHRRYKDIMALLPPRVPTTLTGLDRLIMLLGHRSKGPLTSKTKAELEQLAGCYPDPETCMRWKTALKEIRKELQAEEADRAARGEPQCDPIEDA